VLLNWCHQISNIYMHMSCDIFVKYLHIKIDTLTRLILVSVRAILHTQLLWVVHGWRTTKGNHLQLFKLRVTMEGGIKIYYLLLISTMQFGGRVLLISIMQFLILIIAIVDINSAHTTLISTIRIVDTNNWHSWCQHYNYWYPECQLLISTIILLIPVIGNTY